MNISIVCPYDLGRPGGVQDQVVQLTRWLRDVGHTVTIVGPGVDGPEGAILLGRTIEIQANRSSTPVALNPRIVKRLRKAVQDADVIHIHEPFMPVVSAAAVGISDIATVGTFHADPPRWARVGYSIGSGVWRRLIAKLDVVTTVSHVSASAIAPFSDPLIIPNAIDLDAYGGGDKVVGRVAFLGRDDERKGLQVLLDAWPHIVERVPDAQLHVIGAQRDDLPGVTFLGRTSNEVKIEELAAAEVYCAPNLGGESFGVVVGEGMASRCAVVASAIPAFVSVVADSGELVAPGDPAGLAERVVRLLTDRTLLEARQSSALAAVQQFDGPVVAAQYLSAYESAIRQHTR